MPLSWPKFFQGKKIPEITKGLVTELDILGEGFPSQDQLAIMRTTFGVPYKGKIRPLTAAQIYAQMPVLMACFYKICNYAMQVPLNVYKQRSLDDDIYDEQLVTRGFPANTIMNVNESMTQTDFTSMMAFYLLVFGNAYIAMEPAPEEYKDIADFFLYPMNPTWCSIVPDEAGESLYLYQRAGKRIFFKKEYVIHIKENNPYDNFQGFIKMNSLDYDLSKERFAKGDLSRYFERASNLNGVITMDKNSRVNADEIRKWKKQLEQDYSGPANAYRTLFLENEMKYEKIETQGGAQKAAIDVIADSASTTQMLYGVPAALFTGDARDIEKVEEMFWNSTVKPLLTRIQAQLTKFIQRKAGPKWECRYNYANISALKRQDFTVMRSVVAAINTGYMSVNENRIANGMPPLTGAYKEFGDMPQPMWQLKNNIIGPLSKGGFGEPGGGNPAQSGKTGPSLTVAGSQGGRDQSSQGEAQMADEHGSKTIESIEDYDMIEIISKILLEDNLQGKL